MPLVGCEIAPNGAFSFQDAPKRVEEPRFSVGTVIAKASIRKPKASFGGLNDGRNRDD
jgi:hypothetical protein